MTEERACWFSSIFNALAFFSKARDSTVNPVYLLLAATGYERDLGAPPVLDFNQTLTDHLHLDIFLGLNFNKF